MTALTLSNPIDYGRVLSRTGTLIGFVGFLWLASMRSGVDVHAYWALNPAHPYGSAVGSTDAFLYSPPAVLAFAPFTLIPWPIYDALFAVASALTYVWLLGPLAAPLLLFPPVMVEAWSLNIHLFLAAAIVLSFRYPAAWSVLLLTKVTPGIGVLWFAVRREWRSLAIALASTAIVSLATVALMPDLWRAWLAVLSGPSPTNETMGSFPMAFAGIVTTVPLLPRLILAALLVTLGALRGWRWMVPVACCIAMPVVWMNALIVLIAIARLCSPKARALAQDARPNAVVVDARGARSTGLARL